MLIIKVGATDSTNLHLKRTMAETELQDFTVLLADAQYKGRGQGGNQWISEPGKNLTFSVLKYFKKLDAREGFMISKAVSLALASAFGKLGIPDLSIKWPNDILSGRKKICGILIENTLKGDRLEHAVIGIGININQTHFEGLPHAASLYQIKGSEFALDTVLDLVLQTLLENLERVNTAGEEIDREYDSLLFLKDRTANYEIRGQVIPGVVRGVSANGKLLLQTEGGIQGYALKEVALIQ